MENNDLIQKLVDNKSDRIIYDKNKGRSPVWEYFKLVKLDNKLCSFVKCDRCDKLLKWTSQDGTNSLRNHIDYCLLRSPQPKISGLLIPNKKECQVPKTLKSEVADIVLKMCATDIRFVLFWYDLYI